jgi:hypothetical protein
MSADHENRPLNEAPDGNQATGDAGDDAAEPDVIPTSRENAMLREEQKKRGQYPLHDEPIGGA